MGRKRFKGLGLLALIICSVSLVTCKPPTTDPDQAIREQLYGTTWIPDSSLNESNAPALHFYADGTVFEGGGHKDTWTYKNGVFTIISLLGTETTSPLDITSSHLYINYAGSLVHLIPTPVL